MRCWLFRFVVVLVALHVAAGATIPVWTWMGDGSDASTSQTAPSPRANFGHVYSHKTGRLYIAAGETTTPESTGMSCSKNCGGAHNKHNAFNSFNTIHCESYIYFQRTPLPSLIYFYPKRY